MPHPDSNTALPPPKYGAAKCLWWMESWALQISINLVWSKLFMGRETHTRLSSIHAFVLIQWPSNHLCIMYYTCQKCVKQPCECTIFWLIFILKVFSYSQFCTKIFYMKFLFKLKNHTTHLVAMELSSYLLPWVTISCSIYPLAQSLVPETLYVISGHLRSVLHSRTCV